ncbi:hypothetical protein A9Q86_08115 [Flavobacteriales bacterium 33_180_T64]|nr:hypothetical protein A9Q86_08115 [Flavobacteriales bacterium 33_180_T64]
METITNSKDNTYIWLAEKGTYDLKQQLGQMVDIVSVKPDTLVLPYGILSFKKVPVVLKSKVNYASGYDALYGVKIRPDSVKIIGAEQEISKIDFVETIPFDLNEVKTNINEIVSLELLNASERLKLSEENIKITAEVEKFTEGTFEIPITILNIPNNVELNYFPKHIKVVYYLSLKDYKNIKVNDFRVECNYNDISKTEKSFFVPKLIVSSDKVKSARMKQNKVEYIFIK